MDRKYLTNVGNPTFAAKCLALVIFKALKPNYALVTASRLQNINYALELENGLLKQSPLD